MAAVQFYIFTSVRPTKFVVGTVHHSTVMDICHHVP